MKASIIVCTCNRAESLAESLRPLAALEIPSGLDTELIVVDNGSTDNTSEIALSYSGANMPVRLVYEPQKGQCHARNAGLDAAVGDIILFTDDDLRHPADWLTRMVQPISEGRASAVVGGIRCAPYLERPWMNTVHRAWLACTDHLDVPEPKELIGANMAFAREVLARVPRFDTELGPGALGFCDDTLFSAQLLQAGYRIASAFQITSEHHFQQDRLQRTGFLSAALRMGRSMAYKDYHWGHKDVAALSLRLLRSRLRLAHWRSRHKLGDMREEGIEIAELKHAQAVSYFEAYQKLAGAARNYGRRGLVKLADARARQQPSARAA